MPGSLVASHRKSWRYVRNSAISKRFKRADFGLLNGSERIHILPAAPRLCWGPRLILFYCANSERNRTQVPAKIFSAGTAASSRPQNAGSTPIVDDICIRPVETGCMRTLHRDALGEGPVTVGPHAPVCVLACQVHASLERYAARQGKRIACIEQPVESAAGALATSCRGELDIAELRSAF